MNKFKTRFIAVSFVVLLLCNCFNITVYASADPVTDLYCLFTTDWGHSVLKNQYYYFLNQSDDEFYMNHMQNFNFDATYYQLQQFVDRFEQAGLSLVAPLCIDVAADFVYDELNIESGAKYKCALVDRDLLLALDDTMLHNLGVNGVRYSTLEELGITSNNTFSESGISVTFQDQVCAYLGKYSYSSPIYSFYDFSQAYSNTTEISIYTGGAMPPAFYVPPNCSVFQSGRALDSGAFYVILGTNELFNISETTKYNKYLGFGWYNKNDSVQTACLDAGHASSLENGAITSHVNGVFIWKNGVKESSTIFHKSDTNGRSWTYIDLLNNLSGFMISIDDSSSNIDVPDTFLPEEIPYDDDDDCVYVCIPVDSSNNVTNGDIIYIAPDDYDTYINNGTLVEGDYVNTYSNDTTNNITNNYNNYVNNINNNNNTTVNFDDTRIVHKLDQILAKLTEIKNKITNITVSVDSWDMPFKSIRTDYPNVFSNQPCYTSFSDCIKDSIPLVSDIEDMLSDLDSVENISLVDELNTFRSTGNAPQSSGSSSDRSQVDRSFSVSSAFTSFTWDFSWYEPYRVRIRNLLKVGVWIFFVTSCIHMVKSIFGIHSSS